MVDLSSQYWIALRTDVIYDVVIIICELFGLFVILLLFHYFLKQPIKIGGCLHVCIMGLWFVRKQFA